MLETILKENNVATTALLANYWKYQAKSKANWPIMTQKPGDRNRDLFKDTLMQHFINEDVRQEAEARLDKRMWPPLATRTCFFRRTISNAVKSKEIKQVILLGSGFDTLPVRKEKYTKNHHVRFFEVDQKNILTCKEQIYSQALINKNAIYIGMDYVRENLIEAFKTNSVDFTIPTLILWEGNTFYLEKEEVKRILSDLSNHFTFITITFDYMHALMKTATKALDSSANERCLEKTLDEFSSRKSPFKAFFSPEEIISLCKELGMQCADHKTAAALAKEYRVDEAPYYTAETYSMVTFRR